MLEYNVPKPEIVTTPVVAEILAKDLRPGDVLTDGTVVYTVSTGRKYIRVNDDRVGYTFGEVVRVERQEKTAESLKALEEWSVNYLLVKNINKVHANYLAMQEKFTERFTASVAGPSSFDYENLLEAQVQWMKVWSLVEHFITEQGLAPKEAADRLKARFTKELLEGWEIRGLSKSTSVMSNVLTEVELEAKARFVRDMFWA